MINKDFNSILELLQAFPDEQSCIDHLETLRWNGNVVSPFDPESKVYDCKGNRYKCKETGKYFNVKTGTLFDNSKVALQKWFLAIWLITCHKKGISSVQLGRDIGVTQKTAWFMLHRIRNCFGIDDNDKMTGEVEVDETFVGGDAKNIHASKRKEMKRTGAGLENKTIVMGMIERNKRVTTHIIPDVTKATLTGVLNARVDETATVISDNYAAYRGLGKQFKKHVIVSHSMGQYVKGPYHTNTIEGFWSILKRGIVGIYHFVSKKHLEKYLDEFTFRYNSREMNDGVRFNMMLANTEHRLTYKALINE